ncbi:12886_t:CDS:2, partial [Dentiscutata heterogama]
VVEKDISNLAEVLKPKNTPKGFLLLYVNIDQAKELLTHSEKNVVCAKKEVVLSYYQFEKADAEKLKELLKISIPLCMAQSKIVAEVKKLLPIDTSINTDFDVLQSNDPKGLNSGTNSLESNYTIDILYMDDTEMILDKY